MHDLTPGSKDANINQLLSPQQRCLRATPVVVGASERAAGGGDSGGLWETVPGFRPDRDYGAEI